MKYIICVGVVAGIVCCPIRYVSDINWDGKVDSLDLLRLNSCWGEAAPCCCDADLNRDCIIDAQDMMILLDDWGKEL